MPMRHSIHEFDYPLPQERIAKYPLEQRDGSKLLYYHQGSIESHTFRAIPKLLPDNSLVIFNNTKVIAARMIFFKPSGAKIEIFLLEPEQPYREINKAMEVKDRCVWHCTIGNKKKWKDDQILTNNIYIGDEEISLQARLIDRSSDLVSLEWNASIPFAEIVAASGQMPIPPYLARNEESVDHQRYQTVYSKPEGAVAAPTAGLHFTDEILDQIKQNGHSMEHVTLHVSAGTFRPVKSSNFTEHDMHSEQVIVSRHTVEALLQGRQGICVGTTSLRTIESLYWMGVKLLRGEKYPFHIEKLYPYKTYHNYSSPSTAEALNSILEYMSEQKLDTVFGNTEIFIFPGYIFKLCGGLITNFHLPKSTLLLLIAAFVGDNWKNIYQYALDHNYRFLSYGDSSLLLP